MMSVARSTPAMRSDLADLETRLTTVIDTVDSTFYATAETREAYRQVIEHLGIMRAWLAS
jgi:hypothetical protein